MARPGKTQAASYTFFAASSVEGEPVRKIAVAGHYFARLHCGANDAVLNTRAPLISELACTTNVWRIFMNGERLKPYSSSGLARQEKCFRVRSFSTHLEGPEVFVPFALGNFGIGLHPESKLIQVLDRNASISHPLYQ